MSIQCTQCRARIAQARNRDGPNFCPACRGLFYPIEVKVPTWVFGVLVFLMGNLQVLNQR